MQLFPHTLAPQVVRCYHGDTLRGGRPVSSGVVMPSCRRWLASLFLELVCVQWFMSCLTRGVEAGDDHGQHNAWSAP